ARSRHHRSSSTPCEVRRSFRFSLVPVDDFALVARKLHAAEHTTLVEVADRIGRQPGLLRHGELNELLRATGRAITEIIGAVVVPPGTLVIRSAVEDFEMDVWMFKPDPAELHQVFRFEPDRESPVIDWLVAEIADAQTGHLDAVLVGIKRADSFAESLAD